MDQATHLNNIKQTVKTGDAILFHSNTTLGKAIQYEMKKWGKDHDLHTLVLDGWIANHVGVLIWIADELYVFESIANGYKPTLLIDDYDLENCDYAIIRVSTFNKEIRESDMIHRALKMVRINTFYEYLALLKWAIRIHLGINLFGKTIGVRSYCYKSMYYFYNHFLPFTYKNIGDAVSYFDLIKPGCKLIIKS